MAKKTDMASLIVRERARPKIWFDKLPEETQRELLKVCELVQADESVQRLPTARNLISHFQLEVSAQVLAKWLKS